MTGASESAPGAPYLLPEVVIPIADGDGLDSEYWTALRDERLVVQWCPACRRWQWGPEWVCSACRSFDIAWEEVPTEGGRYQGRIYSWERVWHPTHERLTEAVPYVVVLVALPAAGDVRMIGNLVGDQRGEIEIGSRVQAVFEHHDTFTLVQWEQVNDQ